MNFLKCFVRFPVRHQIQLNKLSLIHRPTYVLPMAEVIGLVSSDDEVVEASAVIAGFCDTRGTRVRLSNSSQVIVSDFSRLRHNGAGGSIEWLYHFITLTSKPNFSPFNVKDSSPIASLSTTVAAGAEGRFVVSDCDGHKRTESTHVENHFEQVCLQLCCNW